MRRLSIFGLTALALPFCESFARFARFASPRVALVLFARKVPRFETFLAELQEAPTAAALSTVIARMRSKGAPVETYHYNVAISRATALGERVAALGFFDALLKERGLRPDTFTIASAVKAAERDWRRALALIEAAPSLGVQPDVFCYTAAVTACRKGGRAREVKHGQWAEGRKG